MPASIFNGDAVKILKDKLRLKSGLEVIDSLVDPLTTPTGGKTGSFLVFGDRWFKKLDDGITSNWTEIFSSGLNFSTGLKTGGNVSIGAPTSTFTVAAGTGVITDNHTDPNIPVSVKVAWAEFTNVTPTVYAPAVTFLGINSAGVLVQKAGQPFSREETRDIIEVGIIVTDGVGTVLDTISGGTFLGSPMNQLQDLAGFIGAITVGNDYDSAGLNQTLKKTSGETFAFGANTSSNRKDPNALASPEQNPVTVAEFLRYYRDGVGGFILQAGVNTVVPNLYDNGTGTLATVPNNRFTTIRLYYGAENDITFYHYGQELYTNRSSAEAALLSADFEKNPEIAGVPLRAWLICRGNVNGTAGNTLGDAILDGRAKFIKAGKFGENPSGGTTTDTTTLQTAYNNSEEPEVTVDATRGAVSIKDNATPIGANLLEALDNADAEVFGVDITETKVKRLGFVDSAIPKVTPTTRDNLTYTDSLGTKLLKKDNYELYFEDFKDTFPVAYFNEAVSMTKVNETDSSYASNTVGRINQTGATTAQFVETNPIVVVGADWSLEPIKLEVMQSVTGVGTWSMVLMTSTDGVSYTANTSAVEITDKKNYKLILQLASDITHVKVRWIIGTPDNATILRIGRIAIMSNAFEVGQTVLRGELEYKTAPTTMLDKSGAVRFATDLNDSIITGSKLFSIVDDAANTATRIVANRDISISVNFSTLPSGANISCISKNTFAMATDLSIAAGSSAYTATANSQVNVTGYLLKKGEFLTVGTTGTVFNDSFPSTNLTISATAYADNVIVDAAVNDYENVYSFTVNAQSGTPVILKDTNSVIKSMLQLSTGRTQITLRDGLNTENVDAVASVLGRDGRVAAITHTAVNVFYVNTTDGGTQENNMFTVLFRLTGADYREFKKAPMFIDVSSERENVYSGIFAPSGGAIIQQNANAFKNPTAISTGITTIDITNLGLTVPPSVTATTDLQGGKVSTTQTKDLITIVTKDASNGNANVNYSLVLQKNNPDYKKPTAFIAGSVALIEANTAGIEYKTNEKMNGKWVYAKTFDQSLPSGTVLVASGATKLISTEGTYEFTPTRLFSLPHNDNSTYWFAEINPSTGIIAWVGSSTKNIFVTIKYLK